MIKTLQWLGMKIMQVFILAIILTPFFMLVYHAIDSEAARQLATELNLRTP
jgi:hypothetical protein